MRIQMDQQKERKGKVQSVKLAKVYDKGLVGKNLGFNLSTKKVSYYYCLQVAGYFFKTWENL